LRLRHFNVVDNVGNHRYISRVEMGDLGYSTDFLVISGDVYTVFLPHITESTR